MILVIVVPSLLASRPPTSGVHVLFSENAEIKRENSVLLVPISRESRDLRGPRIYEALCGYKHEGKATQGGRTY